MADLVEETSGHKRARGVIPGSSLNSSGSSSNAAAGGGNFATIQVPIVQPLEGTTFKTLPYLEDLLKESKKAFTRLWDSNESITKRLHTLEKHQTEGTVPQSLRRKPLELRPPTFPEYLSEERRIAFQAKLEAENEQNKLIALQEDKRRLTTLIAFEQAKREELSVLLDTFEECMCEQWRLKLLDHPKTDVFVNQLRNLLSDFIWSFKFKRHEQEKAKEAKKAKEAERDALAEQLLQDKFAKMTPREMFEELRKENAAKKAASMQGDNPKNAAKKAASKKGAKPKNAKGTGAKRGTSAAASKNQRKKGAKGQKGKSQDEGNHVNGNGKGKQRKN